MLKLTNTKMPLTRTKVTKRKLDSVIQLKETKEAVAKPVKDPETQFKMLQKKFNALKQT